MSDRRNEDLAEQERRIRDAIRSVGDVRADGAFRERLKREFVQGTIAETTIRSKTHWTYRSRRWVWAVIPAAATVLVVALLVERQKPTWDVEAVRGEGQVEVDGRSLAAGQANLVARALGSGGHVRLADGVSLDLRLDERLVLGLDDEADVTVPVPPARGTRGPLVSRVQHGELRIKTGPGFPGTELHVLTSEGRTEIHGTIVSVFKEEGFTCVCVLEGTALIGPDGAGLQEVPQGMRMVLFDDGSEPWVTEIEPEHETDLREFDERYRDVFATKDRTPPAR